MIHEDAALSHLDDYGKRVVVLARRRAVTLHSEAIGPEHMLLALFAVRRGLGARAVANLCGSFEHAETAINEVVVAGRLPSPGHVAFTEATEDAIIRAAQQARLMEDDHIGTEHLLLGLLLATDNVGVRRLRELDVDYDAARAEILRLRSAG
jgi:ATP-dependent Clp protease ATP-binding subunit ClpA